MAERKAMMEALRTDCLARGVCGIKGLAVLFRGMDKDYSKSVCLREFKAGMQAYGIKRSEDQLEALFNYFDKDKSGSVDFREFLEDLRPPMSRSRVSVINEVFDKLDAIKDGVLKVEDLKIVWSTHAKRHPRYVSGEWGLEEVLQHFLDAFDTPGEPDGVVTRHEFLNYYAALSSTIVDDVYFDLMMRSSWGLPAKGSAAS